MLLKNLLEGEAASLSSGARRMLSLLVAECQRLCLLVDELMALAMVEQRPMLPSAVPMQDLVLDVKGQLQAQATGQSTATPEFVVSALPTVQGDAVLLRQVWQNLLGNAWKFSARVARPRVEVSAELQDQEIVFSVRDNGAGFDMAQVDRLFGVFQRLHRTSEFEGTGVGLSIVKRAVQRHGGRVWAHSEPGRGAQFFFSLPVRPPAGPDGTWAAQL
jgi:signal transduction histidine kinase